MKNQLEKLYKHLSEITKNYAIHVSQIDDYCETRDKIKEIRKLMEADK